MTNERLASNIEGQRRLRVFHWSLVITMLSPPSAYVTLEIVYAFRIRTFYAHLGGMIDEKTRKHCTSVRVCGCWSNR